MPITCSFLVSSSYVTHFIFVAFVILVCGTSYFCCFCLSWLMLCYTLWFIGSGAVLARSSQPLVGLMMNMRRYRKEETLQKNEMLYTWFWSVKIFLWSIWLVEITWTDFSAFVFSNTDEKLVAALCTQLASVRGARR